MPSKTVKKLTTRRSRPAKRLTMRSLKTRLTRLQARVEDLEDLRDLNEAIVKNAGKPGIPWETVKAELGL